MRSSMMGKSLQQEVGSLRSLLPHILAEQETEILLESGLKDKPESPCHSDSLSLCELQLTKVPQLPKSIPPAHDQVFNQTHDPVGDISHSKNITVPDKYSADEEEMKRGPKVIRWQ